MESRQPDSHAIGKDKEQSINGSEEFLEFVASHGIGKVYDFIDNQLDAWKKCPIHVAVSGASGTGKSSFINALRDLTPDDPGAAEVGIIERISDFRHYGHPQNEQLKFWDLPCVGSQNFPRSSYLEQIKFDRYDAFVILLWSHLTEDDVWLASELAKLSKPFFFVHNKLDEDIEEELAVNPSSNLPEKVIRQIRIYRHDQLTSVGFNQPNIFLVSSYFPTRYDFPRMTEKFIEFLPQEKRDSWRLSMTALSVASVREKRKILQGKVWMAATASAGPDSVLVPGTDVTVDMTRLVEYQNFYIKQFNLDNKSPQMMAETSEKPIKELKSKIPLLTKMVEVGIIALVKQFAASVTSESVVQFVPVIANAVKTTLSFAVTYAVLNHILDTCEGEAINLLKVVVDEESKPNSP